MGDLRLMTIALSAVLGASSVAHASCPLPPGATAELAQRSDAERARFLRSRLQVESRGAHRWADSWNTGLAVLTLGQLAIIPFTGKPLPVIGLTVDTFDDSFAAFTSAATIASIMLLPLSTLPPPPEGGDSCSEIAWLEHALAVRAAGERSTRGLRGHLTNLLINTGIAMVVLGLAVRHWSSAIYGSISGTLIGEAMLWTKPYRLPSAERAYERGELSESNAGHSWFIGPSTKKDEFGVAFGFVF